MQSILNSRDESTSPLHAQISLQVASTSEHDNVQLKYTCFISGPSTETDPPQNTKDLRRMSKVRHNV